MSRGGLGSCNSNQKIAPKKKLIIKPFKEKPKLPENYEDDAWTKLQLAIDAVSARESISIGREELYQYVENLCLHKMAPKLYQRLGDECERHISNSLEGLLSNSFSSELFLEHVEKVWFHHIDMATTVRSIFLVLDRTYVVQTPGLYSIYNLCLHYLKQEFLKRPEIINKLTESLLDICLKERKGEQVQKSILKNTIRMLTALEMYDEVFSSPFLSASSVFYIEEGNRLINDNCDASTFLKNSQFRLDQVSAQVESYLDARTRRPLLNVVEQSLMLPHVSAILTNEQRGFSNLMDDNKYSDLKLMHSLFIRLGPTIITELKNCFHSYCRDKGSVLVKDETREKTVVKELLDLKEKLDKILIESFSNNEAYKVALKDALEIAVNSRNTSKLAELIAKYADVKLKGEKGVTEQEAEEDLDKLIVLFRYLHSKDVFEAFYKKDLAKRLLKKGSVSSSSSSPSGGGGGGGGSASFELEYIMISKLKHECGNVFTSKLEGMFKDLDLSDDMIKYYHQYLIDSVRQNQENHQEDEEHGSSHNKSSQEETIQLNMKVLTLGYWPTYPSMTTILLPLPLQQTYDKFMKFYSSKYQGRRLSWQHSLGRMILKVCFEFKNNKKHELDVSTFQTLVLYCFNKPYNTQLSKEEKSSSSSSSSSSLTNEDGNNARGADDNESPRSPTSTSTKSLPSVQFTFAELQQLTGIETNELKRTLQSLACAKIRVLVKQPKGKDINETDIFFFNSHFPTQKLYRIKINSIQFKETADENSKTHEAVSRDRNYAIDAVVVRTMKSRKTLKHSFLISEVFSQLPFPTTGPLVKKRIESLIEREYLERDENDSNTYIYLA